MSLDEYLTAREAAKAMGITYSTLLARVRKDKIKSVKVGWALLIPKSEVKAHNKKQGPNNADNKNLEKPTR